MKFPRFKKSSINTLVRETNVEEIEKYVFDFFYGKSPIGDTYEVNFVFKGQSKVHKEIYLSSKGLTYIQMLAAYQYFAKWAKRTHKHWEKKPVLGDGEV